MRERLKILLKGIQSGVILLVIAYLFGCVTLTVFDIAGAISLTSDAIFNIIVMFVVLWIILIASFYGTDYILARLEDDAQMNDVLEKIHTLTCPTCWRIAKYLARVGKAHPEKIAKENGMDSSQVVCHLLELLRSRLIESDFEVVGGTDECERKIFVKNFWLTGEAKQLLEKLEEVARE